MSHSSHPTKVSKKSSRRKFLAATGGIAAGFMIVPRHVLGGSTVSRRQANASMWRGIGAGGMGGGDIATHAKNGINIVALCDVDEQRAAGSFNNFPKAKRYKDFREMIDKEAKDIDAVTVGTPDHTHAVAAMAAIKAGKLMSTLQPSPTRCTNAARLTKAAKAAKAS
ncbi:MAG: Gfo/Idh/MocA family oxidoreductase [Pirellulales bacterium]